MSWEIGSNSPASADGYSPQGTVVKNGSGYQEGEAPIGIDVDGATFIPVVHIGGLYNASIGAAGANASAEGGLAAGCLKGTQGRIAKALVTATGSAALLIYDNAAGTDTGTVIGYIPEAATLGEVITFDMPAMTGISIPAVADAPTITLSYS